jgi:predicted RNA binding protein YcfA (HicA-like mRNA interferase family)
VPPFGPIKRRDLLRCLRELGLEGPYSGGRHQFMIRGELRLYVPNPHQGEIGRSLLARILRQAGIDREDWEQL